MLIDAKQLEELRDTQLQKRVSQVPNANINPDSMIYIDAQVIAEVLYLIQQDAITLTNNAFIAFASGDELTNLGIDRGINRKESVKSTGVARFSRDTLATTNYVIPVWTIISTQPSALDGSIITYTTLNDATLFWYIDNPTGLTGTVITSGGAISAGTFAYVVTAVDGNLNETAVSNNISVVVPSGTSNSISLTWWAVGNAVSYNIYIDTGSWFLLLDNATVPSYVDILGTSASTIIPPVTNNTWALFVDVAIECTVGWDFGNTAPLTIVDFVDKPLGIDSVANLAATIWGADAETDDDYRARIRELLSSNTGKVTALGYKQTAESFPGVGNASVSTGTGAYRNEITIVITADNVTGVPSPSLIAAVQAYITLDENRAPCDNITVVWPTVYVVDYEINVLAYDTLIATSVIEQNIKDRLEAYLPTIPVGTTVYKVGMENIIHDTEWVIDFELVTPATNIALGASEVAIAGTAIINF